MFLGVNNGLAGLRLSLFPSLSGSQDNEQAIEYRIEENRKNKSFQSNGQNGIIMDELVDVRGFVLVKL